MFEAGRAGRRSTLLGAFGVSVALLALSGVSPTATATRGPAASSHGEAVTYTNEQLTAVTAASERDVWAVGYRMPDLYHSEVMVQHWDGSAWRAVSHPEPRGCDGFYDVEALSGDDVWAVGYSYPECRSPYVAHELVEHWDGSAWTVVPTVHHRGELTAVAAVSATDVWAANRRFVEHWDGQRWSATRLPATVWAVTGLSASSTPDVWASGVAKEDGAFSAVVLHWDGTAWSIVYSQPSVRHNGYGLAGVVALSSGDVWAVGIHDYRHGRGRPPMVPFANHWDGGAWTSTRTQKMDIDAEFDAVDATAADDVWAVGTTGACVCSTPMIQHWNGTRWSVATVPSFDDIENLSGVVAVSRTDAWAVGGGANSRAIALEWNGQRWRKSRLDR